MPPRGRTKAFTPQTPQQRLAAVIKRCRDIMRIDPGLNGDLDRLPQMAWLLFLKAYDDLQGRRGLLDADHRAVISGRFRWGVWARDLKLTGTDLLAFVNDDLLPHLKSLPRTSGGLTTSDVIAGIFRGIDNRMRSGYQLRELINELEKIHFESSDDIHTIAHLYESMLREVRDAAGDSGEFYTPRPVIRFMVQQVAPRLGEVVLDPAAGTGGFLVETLKLLEDEASSVAKRERLHASLRGFEKKPLPYLLSTMNLLLHEVDSPRISLANSLQTLITDRSEKSKVHVILTNPPFGGAEDAEVAKAFPKEAQTAETAWLFLYLVMEKLKAGGRCAIVVPNSVLFDGGVGARVKKRLLETCDLHTVVRLPDGVFAPYTDIPSNLLFFEKGRPTKEVWFYQIRPPEGRKKYTKTRPMQYDEFADCQTWWGGADRLDRVENKHAWRASPGDIVSSEYNLDLPNPSSGDDLAHRPPAELIEELTILERTNLALLEEIQRTTQVVARDSRRVDGSSSWQTAAVREALVLAREPVDIVDDLDYRAIGIRSFGRGMIYYPPSPGSQLAKLRYFSFPENALAVSNIKAWEGAVAVTPASTDDYVSSNRFLFYIPNERTVDVRFIYYYFLTAEGLRQLGRASPGSPDRNRMLSIERFGDVRIPIPSHDDQKRIITALDRVHNNLVHGEQRRARLHEALRASTLSAAFNGQL